MPGSRAVVRCEIQEDQKVSRVSAESLPAGFTLSREGNRVYLSASPVHGAELKLQIENDHGLLLTTPLNYAFLVRENAAPSIVIRKPGLELRLEKKEAVQVEYTAEDDIALDSIKLRYWTQSPNVSRILAEGEIQIPVPKGKNASKQMDGSLPLPLENLELLPGHWLSYVLEVRDIYGLGAASTTNVVRLLSLSELFAGQKKTEESIASALRSDKQEAEDIRREAERLSVLREQGKMDPRQAENLASRISQFRSRIQEETEKVRDFQKNLEGNPELFSPEVLEKFKKIEEAYRQIDRDLLRKMEEEFRALVGPTPNKDIQKTAKDWDPKTLTERLDNLLRTLESTKALQETDALEKMAENLYQKYEDLKAFTLAENKAETFDRNKKEISELLKELRDNFQKKKDELFEDAKTDPELKGIQKRLEQNLSDSGQKRFDEYRADEKNLKDLDQFSKDFDALRKDFQLLSRRNRELDMEATVAELNRQIRGFLFLGSQAGALQRGEVLDPEATDPDVVQRELIRFLSDLEGHTEQGRAALYDKIAGYLPGITGFFEIYKQAVEKNRAFQKQLDPSGPFRMSWRYPQAGLGETKLSTLELARHLILLKGALKEQDEAQQNANAMQNGEARQKKMGQ
ncbi:MAG: hypothetical protein JNM63_03280, partial [Spirochaetia bacterium]|nr:hypothetical protein [Spirochaetia bacterium]